MPCMTRRLESSVAARWREKTAGPDERQRNWTTRIGYYQAIIEAIGHRSVDVHTVVDEHRNGKQSTLYSLAARGALVHAYRAHHHSGLRAVGGLVRSEPLSLLVAEVKVWSFWPLRTAWLQEMDELLPAGDFEPNSTRLLGLLGKWRVANPRLAAAHDELPPLCVVEDLMVLSRHALSAGETMQLLRRGAGPAARAPKKATRALGAPCPRRDDATVRNVIAQINSAIDLLVRQPPPGDAQSAAVGLLRAAVRDMAAL